MNDKIITALLAILIALSGWTLTTTVGLKSDVAVLKEKVSGIENEVQNFKTFSKKKKRKKKNQTTERGVQALIIILALALVLLVGCENGARHSIEMTEPTDHTKGDDGGEIKYKIIWGSTKHND